jgi:hypothetical protein
MQKVFIQHDVNKPPQQLKNGEIIVLLGRRGTAKTTFAVSLAFQYKELNQTVFTNIEMYNIEYVPITFDTLRDFPDWLKDGIVIMDEMQMGADSYSFLSKAVRDITAMATQIRKRDLTFIYITQDLSNVAKRLRAQTDFVYEFNRINYDESTNGIARIEIHDVKDMYRLVNEDIFDGRRFFNYFNTKQSILDEKHLIKEEKKKNKKK